MPTKTADRLTELIKEAGAPRTPDRTLDDVLHAASLEKLTIVLGKQRACVVGFQPWTGIVVVQVLVEINQALQAGIQINEIQREINHRTKIRNGCGFIRVRAREKELPKGFKIKVGKEITVDIARTRSGELLAVNFCSTT